VPKDLEKTDLRTKEVRDGTLFRVPNEDPGDLDNTVLKMAVKRAEVDAVNHLPGVSELFPPGNAEQPAEPARPAPVTVDARPAPAAGGPGPAEISAQAQRIVSLIDDPANSVALREKMRKFLYEKLDARKLVSASSARPEDCDYVRSIADDLEQFHGQG
jgi:hypothetical protein